MLKGHRKTADGYVEVEPDALTRAFDAMTTIKLAMATCLLILISRVVSLNIIDDDVFCHIANGRFILVHGLFFTDPLSYYPQSRTISTWLYDVVMAFLYDHLGVPGLCIQAAATMSIFMASSLWFLHEKGRDIWMSFVLVSWMTLLYVYNGIRPELVTSALITLQCAAVEQYLNTEHKRWLYLLPLITYAECNIHGYLSVMHFVCLLPYLIWLPTKRKHRIYFRNIGIKAAVLPVLLMIASLFVTPMKQYLLIDIKEAFSAATGHSQTLISELEPLSFAVGAHGSTIILMVMWLVLFTWALYIFRKKSVPASSVLMIIGLLMLMATAKKQASFFFPVATYLLAESDYDTIEDFFFCLPHIFFYFLSAAALILGTAGITASCDAIHPTEDSYASAPIKAVEWIKENDNSSNATVLNDNPNGAYLNFCHITPLVDSKNLLTEKKGGKVVSVIGELYAFYMPERYSSYFKEHHTDYDSLYEYILTKYKSDYILVPDDTGLLNDRLSKDRRLKKVVTGTDYYLYGWREQ